MPNNKRNKNKPVAGRWVFSDSAEDARASAIETLNKVKEKTAQIRANQKPRGPS